MLFVPRDDKEYDNVYLTTEDDIGLKIDFGKTNSQLLATPKKRFTASSVAVTDLSSTPSEDFE